jgi:hypothetical protein
MKQTSLLITCLALGGLSLLQAGTVASTDISKVSDTAVAPKEQSIYDKIWGLATIYKNNDNPIIEEFDFTGRLQVDYFNVDSSHGNNDFFEIRRFRLGEDAFLFNRYIEIKADLDTALRNYNKDALFYNRMTNLWITYHASEAFNVRLGKVEPKFGYDREVSDTLQPFFERTFFDDNVFNKTGNDYQTAASVLGKVGNWGYQLSLISLDVDKEFGQFNGGRAYLAEISYDFKDAMSCDKALLVLDYMHMDLNANSDVFNTMRNAAATYFDYKKGPIGLVTQVGYGNGISSKGDIWELMVMPTYDITEKLQMELRYAWGHGSQSNTIATINRQESTIGGFTGDQINTFYLGANYFLYGYKLRLMAGIQYTDLTGGTGPKADFSGWTTLVGLRMFW